jgi:hypothetical protein
MAERISSTDRARAYCFGHRALAVEARWLRHIGAPDAASRYIHVGLCRRCLNVFDDGKPHWRGANERLWLLMARDFLPPPAADPKRARMAARVRTHA